MASVDSNEMVCTGKHTAYHFRATMVACMVCYNKFATCKKVFKGGCFVPRKVIFEKLELGINRSSKNNGQIIYYDANCTESIRWNAFDWLNTFITDV